MKFLCTNCGASPLKWEGRCGNCGQWESIVEVEDESSASTGTKKSKPAKAVNISKLSKNTVKDRLDSGFAELNRVLGGGIVAGSVVLLAGEPGIGKSTLLLQVAKNVSQKSKVLYVSGEESTSQLYSRFDRVGGVASHSKSALQLDVTDETNVENISELIRNSNYDLVIVDSIQAVSSQTSRSYSGSIGQVRVSGAILTKVAKEVGVPMIIVGQVNKDGNIAGPKVLEHIVDAVISFEGAEFNQFRIIRGVKNRYGSTQEIGVFEMKGGGMDEVGNPSKVFLEESKGGPGSAIGAMVKGSRVVFVEVQALVVDRGSDFGPLRRVANGIKKPRLDMLTAVLSRRGGVFLGDKDVFVNIAGGLTVDDPSIDLAVCAAIKAAVNDKELDRKTLYYGEVGLTGDIRSGFNYSVVSAEAKRLGYGNVVSTATKKKGSQTLCLKDL